ncbi:protein MAIN-LIKE 2-like [Camellia sinensis]|uniref:protein MAIN-LIKE 2-like n=1 Tax=Camellia sinensis TaxID=4442 RepID=UPI001036560C|nr:protein MAIN-LIKE 2-like [Camellia sinensis]
MELPDDVRHIVDQASFGIFCMGLSRLTASRPPLGALVERWWDTTDSFHLFATREMTMTPFDFSMLTSIGVEGDLIPFDTDMGEWDAAQIYLLDARPPLSWPRFVRYSWFEDQFRIQAPTTREEVEQYARGFIMLLLGTTLFADRVNTVALYLLSTLVDVTWIMRYDWGGAGLATFYGYMSSLSHRSRHLLGGYWRAWELWVYAYFPRLAPEPKVEMPLAVLFSHRFDVRCERRPQESFLFFRRYFDTVTAAEITWQPWAALSEAVRD